MCWPASPIQRPATNPSAPASSCWKPALLADPAANHHIARLHIEADEPPIYRALDLLCHNEQMRADGHPPDSEHWASVPLYQRLTCHLFHWPDLAA